MYDYFFPAYKAGGPIQSIANLVNQFSENINYRIFCSNNDLDTSTLNVVADKWFRYNAHAEVYYSSTTSITILKKEVREYNPDILFINGIYSFRYNILPLLFCQAPRKIISARGMLHPGALSQKKNKKRFYLSILKLLGIHKKYEFHASNEEEKKYIQKIFGDKAIIHIAYNFPRVLEKQIVPEKLPGSLKLISIALISPMKNHLLVINALQSCTQRIQYDIYGPIKDELYWKQCLEAINKMPANISVKYHGDIEPDRVENILKNSHVFILPSKSENFGHAIYEALSAGRPVITSTNTPWNDLQSSSAGINVSLNETEISMAIDEFANMDDVELEKWSVGAHKYARKAIDLNSVKDQYRKMFAND